MYFFESWYINLCTIGVSHKWARKRWRKLTSKSYKEQHSHREIVVIAQTTSNAPPAHTDVTLYLTVSNIFLILINKVLYLFVTPCGYREVKLRHIYLKQLIITLFSQPFNVLYFCFFATVYILLRLYILII